MASPKLSEEQEKVRARDKAALKQALAEAEMRLPLPDLAARMGCVWTYQNAHSYETWVPWRENPSTSKRPSLSIFQKARGWFWKDFGRPSESGRAVDFLMRVQNLPFIDAAELYCKEAGVAWEKNRSNRKGPALKPLPVLAPSAPAPYHLPDKPVLNLAWHEGSDEELTTLSKSRNGISVESLRRASDLGWLKFGLRNKLPSWWLTDREGWMAESRRLDRQDYPEMPPRENFRGSPQTKSKAAHGTAGGKLWAIGANEIGQAPVICLVEGAPDFLAAHDLILKAGLQGEVAPVAVLGAACRWDPAFAKASGLEDCFKGKTLLFLQQNDVAGQSFVEAWAHDLKEICPQQHIVPLSKVFARGGVNDESFNDVNDLYKLPAPVAPKLLFIRALQLAQGIVAPVTLNSTQPPPVPVRQPADSHEYIPEMVAPRDESYSPEGEFLERPPEEMEEEEIWASRPPDYVDEPRVAASVPLDPAPHGSAKLERCVELNSSLLAVFRCGEKPPMHLLMPMPTNPKEANELAILLRASPTQIALDHWQGKEGLNAVLRLPGNEPVNLVVHQHEKEPFLRAFRT